ncbi:hypothetical protein [Streptomyces sp. S.PB5]|uniref:hypothetical protein n=1 Tax=Streptomyces sp. S.PB5 TaxID=3020844 RepID=UPI0025AF388C|nr:hypothetical protein [Streptomyces sp. S.PB5]MDN3024666.1 hypothetical protein [Streptomyces sp. S.PB5]
MTGQRRRHRVGDVFAPCVEGGGYRFGRIVKIGPPFLTMNWPWSKGYFRTVAHEELGAALADFAHFQDQLDEALAGRPVCAPYPKA